MTIKTTANKIVWVQDIANQQAGGKAHGLQQLQALGLQVPPAFVIINAQADAPFAELEHFYQQLLPAKVAVRSSALGEDGAVSSFAGQYATVLNVGNLEELQAAISTCIDSLHSAHATAYQQQAEISTQMNIVVQTMVDAASAGVVFSADPVSGRYDRCVIDAVNGLGEALVSGEVTPDHYVLNRFGENVEADLSGSKAILTPAQQRALFDDALKATQAIGHPLDLEWAIDAGGTIFWLQARPITTLGSDLNELDTAVNSGDVLTRCNIGEMMPGASCPLTFSVTGRGIEYGMQHMHVSYAGRKAITDDWTQVSMSYGLLFLNLTGTAAAAETVLGVSVKALVQNICGRAVEEVIAPKKRALFIRLVGAWRLLRYVQNADRVIAAYKEKLQAFSIAQSGSCEDRIRAIDKALAFLNESYAVHLQSSATSGFASSILQAMVSGGQISSPAQEAEAANLMAGASGVESAVLLEQLDAIIDVIVKNSKDNGDTTFITVSATDALDYLQHKASKELQAAFAAFIQRHGHRGYRELCLREPSWGDIPENLLTIMQASVSAKLQGNKGRSSPKAVDITTLSRGLRWILPKAHSAIRRREATKSMLVAVTHRIKCAYRNLAEQLVAQAKLDAADLLFFFTHEELLQFIVHDSNNHKAIQQWNDKARLRKVAFEFQNRLHFAEICVAKPEPLERMQAINSDAAIIGRPVSAGIVEGRARLAFNVSEAAALEPGEILVAPITDVGWTPYFSMIAGLITDVGSAVSHGAVIAREYGLPAIVNTHGATQRIKTGDLLRLDANSGEVIILEAAKNI